MGPPTTSSPQHSVIEPTVFFGSHAVVLRGGYSDFHAWKECHQLKANQSVDNEHPFDSKLEINQFRNRQLKQRFEPQTTAGHTSRFTINLSTNCNCSSTPPIKSSSRTLSVHCRVTQTGKLPELSRIPVTRNK
ncbi:hypothetical protein CDAR_105911 [Caerostris darwini]|uniref:Uncharacterized protein n=1 Tax=Caerostris darwini TaxID=1538125 RepID=A0AAV4TSE3_9ARAC|nr:hypothetical protein CDAR_105911 [Caerostris darwini]